MAYRLFHNLHYGLNAAEVSSPSSSIIFPFLLVPLIAVGLGQVSNLLICLLSTIGSGFLLCEILSLAGYQFKAIGLPTFTLLAVMFAFDTNLVGVAFTGMEHSLQIMLCLACLLGAQKLGKTKRPGWLLMVGAAAAPLVRYECISILLGTVLLLVWYRNFRSAAGLLVIGGLPLIAFSLFLCAHGLAPLPSSILAKVGAASPLHQDEAADLSRYIVGWETVNFALAAVLAWVGKWRKVGASFALTALACCIIFGLLAHIGLPQLRPEAGASAMHSLLLWKIFDPVCADGFPQLVLIAAWLAASIPAAWKAADGRLEIATLGIFVVGAQCVAGQMGWFCRYQVYALVFGFTAILIVRSADISAFLGDKSLARRLYGLAALSAAAFPFVWCTIHTPAAAQNIYDQQFQMRRFAFDFYHGPVAVNDIGLVGWARGAYVLDTWGLASEAARKARMTSKSTAWLRNLTAHHDVDMAMIYPRWFGEIPADWRLLGTLTVTTRLYTPAQPNVAFYATTAAASPGILAALHTFSKQLPASDIFIFQ